MFYLAHSVFDAGSKKDWLMCTIFFLAGGAFSFWAAVSLWQMTFKSEQSDVTELNSSIAQSSSFHLRRIVRALRRFCGFLFVCFITWSCRHFICPIAIAQHGTDYKITSVTLSVCLSVNTLTIAILIRFWWNFAQWLGAREVRSSLFLTKIW